MQILPKPKNSFLQESKSLRLLVCHYLRQEEMNTDHNVHQEQNQLAATQYDMHFEQLPLQDHGIHSNDQQPKINN